MPPLGVMIKPVSGSCNMRCRYCFYLDEMSNRSVGNYGVMSEKTLESLVKKAFDYADGGVSFAFQGGEPTLAGSDYFNTFLALQKRYNSKKIPVQCAIQTNGCDLPDDLLELFAKNRFLAGVSLDGIDFLHDAMRIDKMGNGTYRRVIENISRMREHGAEFNILCVVSKAVALRASEVLQALKKYKYIQFIPRIDSINGQPDDDSLTPEVYGVFLKSAFDVYYKAYRENAPISVRDFDNYIGIFLGREPENCAMRGICGVNYLVESDGSVFPCDFFALDEWKMGNVNHNSFYELSKSPIGRAFRQRSVRKGGQCRFCRWFILCRCGCLRERRGVETDRPYLHRFCEAYKDFFTYAEPGMRHIAKIIANGIL